MTIRTTRKSVTFGHPFCLSAIDAVQPSGTYTIDTDEELIDGLSFLAYRRIATLLHRPSRISESHPHVALPARRDRDRHRRSV